MGVVVHEFEVDVVGQEAAPSGNSPGVPEDRPKLGTHQLSQVLARLDDRTERLRAH